MKIRSATADDLLDITRIYNDAILRTTATFDIKPKSTWDRFKWFTGHSDAYPLIVAEIEDKIVGWADIHPFGERQAYQYSVENAIYVDSDAQAKGVGSALLERLIELSSEQGYHAILALIVAGNDASLRLHCKFGFEQTGTMREVGRKFDRWLDLLIFEKLLNHG